MKMLKYLSIDIIVECDHRLGTEKKNVSIDFSLSIFNHLFVGFMYASGDRSRTQNKVEGIVATNHHPKKGKV